MSANHVQVPAFNIYGRKELIFTIRRDTEDSSKLFISSPPYSILDTQGVYELCNQLTDMIEQLPEENHCG